MNKRIIFLLSTIACVMILVALLTAAYANNKTDGVTEPPVVLTDLTVDDSPHVLDDVKTVTEKPDIPSVLYYDLYNEYIKTATEEQKSQLNEIGWGGCPFWSPRDMMIIMGKLKEDQPRLTADDVLAVWNSIDEDTLGKLAEERSLESCLVSRFNSIAGAPDTCGGSGVLRTVYNLADGEGSITIWNQCIVELKTGEGTIQLFPAQDK